MRLRKPFICFLYLFVGLLLTGCARNGESITLNIQPDGDLRSDEINLLHILYIPMMEEDEDGLVVRTCPEDIQANSLVGHHYYVPTMRNQDGVFQLVIHSARNRQYKQGKASIESPEIYIGESYVAIFFYIEAWHFEDIDSRQQGSFGERFQRLNILSGKKELLYANSTVLKFHQDGNAVYDLQLLANDRQWPKKSRLYWLDSDGDLFGWKGAVPDCIDNDKYKRIEIVQVSLGCKIHPFAPSDGCLHGRDLGCDCQGITQTPIATLTNRLTPPTISNTPTITPTQPTATPSVTPTRTSTPEPTPTFNFAPLSRATSAAPAQCPAEGDPEIPDLASVGSIGEEDLEQIRIFLSEGGSVEDLRGELAAFGQDGILVQRDLTGDGVPEVILTHPILQILGCSGGSYQLLLQVYPEDPTFPVLSVTIADLNGNTLPELVVETEFWGMHDYTLNVRVYEWDGEDFVNRMASEIDHPLLELGRLYWESGRALMYNGDLKLGDVDINGTIELVLRGGYAGGLAAKVSMPQLIEQHIWMWNGSEYTLVEIRYDEPVYKYQAASIGDLYSLIGNYDDAIATYQQAIFDSDLNVWNQQKIEAQYFGGDLDLFQNWDQQNYEQAERINMYARFRMLVVNYLIGNDSTVVTQYDSLQRIAEGGSPGKMYAELARAFVESYQGEGSITQACRAAQQFAKLNEQEILWPLGPSAYGEMWWGPDSEEICPFGDEDRAQ